MNVNAINTFKFSFSQANVVNMFFSKGNVYFFYYFCILRFNLYFFNYIVNQNKTLLNFALNDHDSYFYNYVLYEARSHRNIFILYSVLSFMEISGNLTYVLARFWHNFITPVPFLLFHSIDHFRLSTPIISLYHTGTLLCCILFGITKFIYAFDVSKKLD